MTSGRAYATVCGTASPAFAAFAGRAAVPRAHSHTENDDPAAAGRQHDLENLECHTSVRLPLRVRLSHGPHGAAVGSQCLFGTAAVWQCGSSLRWWLVARPALHQYSVHSVFLRVGC
jgi:hypothetical protein